MNEEQNMVAAIAQLDEMLATPPKRVLLTCDQARQFLEELKDKECRWVDERDTSQWARKPLGSGYTHLVAEAEIFTVVSLLAESGYIMIELLDQELARVIAARPIRKCRIESLLDANLIASLKLIPNHPTYRGLVMAKVGKMPPADALTYDQLKDWIEFNFDKKVTAAQQQMPPPPAARALRHEVAFTIQLNFTDTEYGTCNYRVPRSGSGVYEIEASDVNTWVEDGMGVDAIMAEIEQLVDGGAWDVQVDMDEDGEYEYHNHESGDDSPTDGQWEYGESSNIRLQDLINYLRSTLTQEQQERLGIAP
jgi:hypothetical protein